MGKPVLVRGELLDGLDVDGNAQVIIPYSPQTEAPHGRVRFVDPASVIDVRAELMDQARALSDIADPDEWEKAVEAVLLNLASAVGQGVMMQRDYTRKTQELAAVMRQRLTA